MLLTKTAQTILIKKLSEIMAFRKKALLESEHGKNYILRDVNYFIKMSYLVLLYWN